MVKLVIAISVILLITACDDGIFRGYQEPSENGKTYLVFEKDKGGGNIDSIYLDYEKWNFEIGEKALIQPGKHCVSHSSDMCHIEFEVQEGTVFHFDYWGP